MIEVKGLSAGYGGTDVLHDISFSLRPGDALSIIGPNGCGKSTLLRAMAGVLPFSGEVLIDGESIRGMEQKHLAKKVSMLSQSTQVYFNYTVFETVMMGRYVHARGGILGGSTGEDRAAVEAALQAVDLSSLRDREVDTLSGGQLQRVFLAKILAQSPDIILLDEPTNHLDFSYQLSLVRFLKDWAAKEKKTVIAVLHDINLALLLSEQILLLEDGVTRAFGQSRDVLSGDALAQTYQMDVVGYMLESLKKWEQLRDLRTQRG